MIQEKPVTEKEIRATLKRLGGWSGVYVPEFTFQGVRIDALVVDTRTRWIRGFEIKTNRADFLQDDKWIFYSEFCSSLSFACPADLIKKEKVKSPFGLLYLHSSNKLEWVRKPKRFQRRDSLAWQWQYTRVIEAELRRLQGEIDAVSRELDWQRKRANELKAALPDAPVRA